MWNPIKSWLWSTLLALLTQGSVTLKILSGSSTKEGYEGAQWSYQKFFTEDRKDHEDS
jgi:hypothetical protein